MEWYDEVVNRVDDGRMNWLMWLVVRSYLPVDVPHHSETVLRGEGADGGVG